MVKSKLSIVWTEQAKLALKEVYKFHKKISVEWAAKIRDKIYQSPEALIYSNQYQLDENNSDFRRIVVGHYKVLYQEKKNVIYIMDVVCSLQAPKTED